jgi:hypothetical protein
VRDAPRAVDAAPLDRAYDVAARDLARASRDAVGAAPRPTERRSDPPERSEADGRDQIAIVDVHSG